MQYPRAKAKAAAPLGGGGRGPAAAALFGYNPLFSPNQSGRLSPQTSKPVLVAAVVTEKKSPNLKARSPAAVSDARGDRIFLPGVVGGWRLFPTRPPRREQARWRWRASSVSRWGTRCIARIGAFWDCAFGQLAAPEGRFGRARSGTAFLNRKNRGDQRPLTTHATHPPPRCRIPFPPDIPHADELQGCTCPAAIRGPPVSVLVGGASLFAPSHSSIPFAPLLPSLTARPSPPQKKQPKPTQGGGGRHRRMDYGLRYRWVLARADNIKGSFI